MCRTTRRRPRRYHRFHAWRVVCRCSCLWFPLRHPWSQEGHPDWRGHLVRPFQPAPPQLCVLPFSSLSNGKTEHWPRCIGSIIVCASQNIGMLVAGRFINGLSVGICSAQVPVYVSELAPPSKRGRVVGAQQWAITWGILIMYYIRFEILSLPSILSLIFLRNQLWLFVH